MRVNYPPTPLPLHLIGADPMTTFAALFPTDHAWLAAQDVAVEVTAFCWPETLARLLHVAMGQTVCELGVEIADPQQAARFSQFIAAKI